MESFAKGGQGGFFDEPLTAKPATAQATFAEVAADLLGRAIKLKRCVSDREETGKSPAKSELSLTSIF